MRSISLLSASLLLLASCAAQPERSGGNQNLPNANAGPFRPIATPELGNLRSAPNAIDDTRRYARDPSVLDLDGDPTTLEVIGFFGAAVKEGDKDPEPKDPTRSIVRHGALDGRSFDRSAELVLVAEEPWEGGVLGAPMAVRVDQEIFLYYAAEGGIGLARGPLDKSSFSRVPGPVLGPGASGWDKGSVPKSPGVVRLDDGSYRMFYEASRSDGSSAIGEARSDDGIHFERVSTSPVLDPLGAGSVGAPFPWFGESALGRPILRLYYVDRNGAGASAIGLAARFGDDEAFERAAAPVLGSSGSLNPTEPCVVPFDDFALLFVTQLAARGSDHAAVAVGVAPGTAALPPPNPP